MAVRFCFPAGSRCRMAQAQRCPTRRRPLANRYFGNRVVRPFMGLLALPRIFPAAAIGFCRGARIDCDGADKHGFARDSGPASFAITMAEFIRDTADRLLQAGAYLQAADGEGVVAIFGFPGGDSEHAEKALRVVLDLIRDSRKRQQNNGEISVEYDIHAGVSSGAIIAAPLKDGESPALLISGEPLDLARRFCSANRRYGSKILMGTPTFDLASDSIVARPIDFVDGVNSQDRHEIYEPLWLATEAGPEHIARRDSFWSGVILYREKRWAEAYTEFQKARGSEHEEDRPVQFYLRRLELRALSELTEMPSA